MDDHEVQVRVPPETLRRSAEARGLESEQPGIAVEVRAIEELMDGLYVAVDEAGIGDTDDGDEFEDFWVAWLAGPDIDALVAAARGVLADQQLLDGAYAFVTDPEADDFEVGRRIDF